MRSRYVESVDENANQYYFRVKPVLVGSNGVNPFGPGIVTRYEETLLRSEAAGVKIRALLFCK